MELYDLPTNKVFLISAKGVILNKKGEMLLLQVSKDESDERYRLKWDLPGGLVEVDEKLRDALVREIKEECNIEVKVKNLVSEQEHLMKKFKFKNGTVKDVTVMLLAHICKYSSGNINLSEEHENYRWVDIKKLNDWEIIPSTRLLIEKALRLSPNQN